MSSMVETGDSIEGRCGCPFQWGGKEVFLAPCGSQGCIIAQCEKVNILDFSSLS